MSLSANTWTKMRHYNPCTSAVVKNASNQDQKQQADDENAIPDFIPKHRPKRVTQRQTCCGAPIPRCIHLHMDHIFLSVTCLRQQASSNHLRDSRLKTFLVQRLLERDYRLCMRLSGCISWWSDTKKEGAQMRTLTNSSQQSKFPARNPLCVQADKMTKKSLKDDLPW